MRVLPRGSTRPHSARAGSSTRRATGAASTNSTRRPARSPRSISSAQATRPTKSRPLPVRSVHNGPRRFTIATGNMTSVPQPPDMTAVYQGIWDAWNRLVGLYDGSTLVQGNAYDGLNRRTQIILPGETRDDYYTADWQLIQEDSTLSATTIFYWGQRYIDELIARFDLSSSAFIYSLPDANWNVVAIADSRGRRPGALRLHGIRRGAVPRRRVRAAQRQRLRLRLGDLVLRVSVRSGDWRLQSSPARSRPCVWLLAQSRPGTPRRETTEFIRLWSSQSGQFNRPFRAMRDAIGDNVCRRPWRF